MNDIDRLHLKERVWRIHDKITQLRDVVGALDDVYESDQIDSRSEPGCWQLMNRVLANLECYVLELENDLDGASPPASGGN
jgi:hypothetical protein